MARSMPVLKLVGVIAASMVSLALLAVINGQPFLFPDSSAYIRGADAGAQLILGPDFALRDMPNSQIGWGQDGESREFKPAANSDGLTSLSDKVVLSGRSVYYGVLLYAGLLAGSAWFALALQTMIIATILALVALEVFKLPAWIAAALISGVAVFSSLGFFAGFFMPDIFAGVLIVAMPALWFYWRTLSPFARAALSLAIMFSLAVHPSHLAIGIVLTGVFGAASLAFKTARTNKWPVLISLAAISLAVVSEAMVTELTKRYVGAAPLRLPHLSAHMIDLGPGADYLRDHCPEAGFALCDYADRLPETWTDFLFSNDPARGVFALADPETKRALSEEQIRFVLAVTAKKPIGVILGAAGDAVEQIVRFETDIGHYPDRDLAIYERKLPGGIGANVRASKAASGRVFNTYVTMATYASLLAGLGAIGFYARANGLSLTRLTSKNGELDRGFLFFAAVCAGVLVNAGVCGALASPTDRFGARVIWAIPFVAIGLALASTHIRQIAKTGPIN